MWPGMTGHGGARFGRRGKFWQGWARLGEARRGKARQARHGKAW